MVSGINNANSKTELRGENIKKYVADHGGTIEGVAKGLYLSGYEVLTKYALLINWPLYIILTLSFIILMVLIYSLYTFYEKYLKKLETKNRKISKI